MEDTHSGELYILHGQSLPPSFKRSQAKIAATRFDRLADFAHLKVGLFGQSVSMVCNVEAQLTVNPPISPQGASTMAKILNFLA